MNWSNFEPSLTLTRLSTILPVAEVQGTAWIFTSWVLAALKLSAPVALFTILLAGLSPTVCALETTVRFLAASVVYEFKLLCGETHLQVTTLEGGSLGEVHPEVQVWLDDVQEFGKEGAVVVIKGDGGALANFGMRLNIFFSRAYEEEVAEFEGEM